MLDISFYTTNGQPPSSVEVAEELYEWLAKSEFSKIGKSNLTTIQVDGDEERLLLVKLGKVNRKKFTAFLNQEILRETEAMLTRLGDSPSTKEYKDETHRLRKLYELLNCVKDNNYQYLQRV